MVTKLDHEKISGWKHNLTGTISLLIQNCKKQIYDTIAKVISSFPPDLSWRRDLRAQTISVSKLHAQITSTYCGEPRALLELAPKW